VSSRHLARISALALSAALALPRPASAQAGSVAGTVVDSATGAPVVAVHVGALDARNVAVASTVTDDHGLFRLAGLAAGTYTLRLARIGYRPVRLEDVAAGSTGLAVAMTAIPVPIAPVVVSVERAEQTTLEAPASISVVSREQVAENTAMTAVEHVRTTTGVDFASKGLTSATFSTRGSRSSNSTVLMVLTDYRYAAVPSLRLNVPYLIPASDDDIERIEVLRGASTALYGPDSDRGVLHIITRSPFDSRGASLTVTGGEREMFGVAGRYAGVASPRLAAKLSFGYLRGRDWPSDTADVSAAHDPVTERVTAEARLDWRPGPHTEVVGSAGFAEAIRNVDITDVGPFQVRHWRYGYYQARVRHRDLFANLVLDLSDAGQTFNIRNRMEIVDESRLLAGQLQHRHAFRRSRFVYGVDTRLVDPRTRGTINGRFENHDQVSEVGAYVSSTTSLSPHVDLVAAARADHHSFIGDVALSPRVGLVWTPRQEHALRLTYNRAFSTPATAVLFLDYVEQDQLCDNGLCLPFAVRGSGTPQGGYSFRRDCNGLCMRSPFTPDPTRYLPTDATLLWPAVVALAQQYGVDLSGMPAPTSADVGSELRALNVESGRFDIPVSATDVRDLSPNSREITDALEIGWKGLLGQRLFAGVDLYYNRVSNVMGAIQDGTPSVFFNGGDLQTYLQQYLTVGQANTLAALISQAPVGTVSPQESPYPTDILLVTPQGGAYTFIGLDLDLQARLSERFSVSGNYSWVSRDSVNQTGALANWAMGAPKRKGSVALEYRDERRGLTASARARALSTFPVVAGQWRGTVDAYAVVDLAAGCRLPWGNNVRLSVTAFNVLDNRHREYVGAPRIGRLIVSRLHARF
jgi:iron complex outermembrane receptor protein